MESKNFGDTVKPFLTYQCITMRHRMAHYLFVHALSIFHCGNLYFHVAFFFKLHSFHVALFSYCTIFMLHFFVQQSFYVALFFVLHFHYLIYCTFTRCNVFALHSSQLHSFNFFLLHFVHGALFSGVYTVLPQTSKMESFATIINKAVKSCCKLSVPGTHYYFHVAFLPCCSFFMQHSFHVALF